MEHFRAISRLTTPIQPNACQGGENKKKLFKDLEKKKCDTLTFIIGT